MSTRHPDRLKRRARKRCTLDEVDAASLDFHCALVIEEDEELRGALVRLLRERGWLVHATRRAEQAVPVLGRIPYHLIITDAELPGLSGIEFVRMLHHSREWSSIPVIVMANTRSHQAIELGACVIRKAAWFNELAKALAGIEGQPRGKGKIYANREQESSPAVDREGAR